jgi:hypothetical protein
MESCKAMAGSKERPFALQHCYNILVTMDVMTREQWDMKREVIIERRRQARLHALAGHGGACGGDTASGGADGGVNGNSDFV